MSVRRVLIGLAITAMLFGATAAGAFSPDEPLDDPALEARAQTLNKGLRCLVCQGQSIADSNAELARDLRVLVRERLAAGDSDDDVTDYLTDRYGDFILMNPPVKGANYVLWFGPVAALLVGGAAVFFVFRRTRASRSSGAGRGSASAQAPLTPDEQRRLDTLLDDDPS